MHIAVPYLADHPWLLDIAVAMTGALGWTTILIGSLIGAGLSATASGIKMGVEGDWDTGQFFRDMGIGLGTGGLTAGLGSAIGSALGTGASAASSAGANAAAAPAAGATGVNATSEVVSQGVQQAAAQAPAGTFGATGTAVANGAVAPAGASGSLTGATSSADLARSIANMVPDAVNEAGVKPAQEALTQAGNRLAEVSPKLADMGVPGPSYPQFQSATALARGDLSGAAFDTTRALGNALTTAPRTTTQRVLGQALAGTAAGGGAGYAQNPRDWRGPVYGALAGGASGGLGTGTSTAIAPVAGQQIGNLAGRVVGSTAGGAIRGLGSDDPGNGALTGAASGAVGSGVGGIMDSGWNAISPDSPLIPLKQIDGWRGIPYARDNDPVTDFLRTLGSPHNALSSAFDVTAPGPGDDQYAQALGVAGMRQVQNQLSGQASGLASSAVGQALSRPTTLLPPLPTSGPAMYSAMRTRYGAGLPILARSLRRY